MSLEVAAKVDIEDGELESSPTEDSMYAQPSLKDQPEERLPLPYRRDERREKVKEQFEKNIALSDDGVSESPASKDHADPGIEVRFL